MIDKAVLETLKKTKNLLAFSAGVDSSTLFFLLLENSIDFDLAFVNYHTRNESDLEEIYAKELAEKYNKKLFIKSADSIRSNFEATARSIRYNFFEETIRSNGYNVLITAHQLNDWSEWFLMQFTKGAGFFELSGMSFFDARSDYTIARPLLNITRDEIEKYLKENSIKHFLDSSNDSEKYTRNIFRKNHISPLMEQYSSGIKRTFEIFQNELDLIKTKNIKRVKDLFIIDLIIPDLYHQIDLAIKKLGHLCSYEERKLIRSNSSIVVGRKIAVCKNNDQCFIAPYTQAVIPKEIRERFRVKKIPPKIRSYIFENGIDINQI